MKTAIEAFDYEMDKLKKLQEELNSWKQYSRVVDEVIAKYPGFGLEVQIGIQFGQSHGILVTLNAQNTFDLAICILKEFQDRGFQSQFYDDYAVIHRRSFHLLSPDEKMTYVVYDKDTPRNVGVIKLHVFLKEKESDTGKCCTYEQVGQKMVPVYDVVCYNADGNKIEKGAKI